MNRPFRLTIRGRLTLVYGGLFLAAGILLLVVTYMLGSSKLVTDNRIGRPNAPAANAPAGLKSTKAPAGAADEDFPSLIREARLNALREVLEMGAVALGLVGVAAIGCGWLLAGRLLGPVHRITATARRIADAPAADRRLGERIALAGPRDELKDLADTFDLMLERIDRSLDGQRRFIANASHELRTPLALNRTLIEVSLDPAAGPVELREFRDRLIAINSRHERLIDGLLLLARSEREVTRRDYVDLADLVEHAVAQIPAGAVRVRTELGEAAVTGDAVLLERLVHNLIDNAVKHNRESGGEVGVKTRTPFDGTVILEVTNTGAVVPAAELERLFEPFQRADRAAAVPGAGLGLSIVRAVARAHGGEVSARPHDCGGLLVTVTLPAAG